ncbi:MAG: hypothetical protein ACI4UE_04265 [Candidatus Scatovivens sp.]
MELKGQIEEIIYQNEVNSYTIAVLSTEDDLITIVGYLPFVNVRRLFKSVWKNCCTPRLWRTI